MAPSAPHLHLLAAVPRYDTAGTSGRLPLSAVIVPTHRPLPESARGLGLAAACADAEGAQLVVLRSGEATATPYPRSLAPRTAPALVVDAPGGFPSPVPAIGTTGHPVDVLHRAGDLGAKRNTGLLLGQLCGWRTVLFLDDDISTTPVEPGTAACDVTAPLRLNDVLRDFATYPDLEAAAFVQEEFADNSVACHARRLAGRRQGQFVSGGALVVRCGAGLPFFPATYNEDWLFFFTLMVNGRHHLPSSAVKLAGRLLQAPYYPFTPDRARSEELGDMLAEGLFGLLQRSRADVLSLALQTRYWELVVRERQDMLIGLMHDVGRDRELLGPTGDDARAALAVALGVHAEQGELWAARLAGYMCRYLDDVERWQELLHELTPAHPHDQLAPQDALQALGLAGGAERVASRRGVHGDRLSSTPAMRSTQEVAS